MKLLKAFRAFKKTTAYARQGLYAFEAAWTCPKTGKREFCSIEHLPDDVSEFIIDVFALSGQIGFRDRDWVHSFSATWDGSNLTCKQIGN